VDRIETRELAYFIVVAEELHFGRAARRLGMAQPPLSRAVRQLERRLGVTLLERDSQRVALTQAGEVLLHEGRRALEAVAAAARRAQRTGQPEPRLVLVMKPGGDVGLLQDILAAYKHEPAALLPVDVLVGGVGEQAPLLRDGRADVGFLRTPHDELSGLDSEELLAERQVLVVPARHRLAGRSSVRLADLAGEPMPRWPGMPAGPAAPPVRDAGQLMQLIALGRTVAVLPESVHAHLRSDLVCVPVRDAPPTTVVVAWPEHSRSLAVAAFVRACTAVAAHHHSAAAAPAAP
jgi:DNA-binding transcriptional LysR family regulator